MIFEKEFQRYGFDNIVAYSGTDITDKMIEESFKISEAFFDAEYQIKDSQIRELIKHVGQICFMIYDKSKKQVIGYSFWLPIKSKVFIEFLKNKEMLMFIKEDYCAKFNEPTVNLFQTGEAFVAGYDLDNLHRGLEDIIQEKILVLARKGVKVEYIAIEAVCKYDEEYLAPLMGLTKKIKKGNSSFFCDKYSPRTTFARSKVCAELKEYYK